MPEKINLKEQTELFLQWFLGQLVILPLGFVIIAYLTYGLKYRIRELKRLRKQYREIIHSKQPILIASNHLTMIDSIILHMAFNSVVGYFFNYRSLSWNMPAREVFGTNWRWKYLTYLGKSIPVDRNGSREHHDKVLRKTMFLLKKGEPFTIFPEGGRTRTGKIDIQNVRYGIGSIISNLDTDCRVLCVYMRGDGQEQYSNFPKKGETFYIKADLIHPKTDATGIRAHRDLTMQVVNRLEDMEKEYFETHNPSGE